ncbi:MAG: M20/M25/M40 family metallo-hydrolase, partial [Micromonosporaceae bacterium]
MITPPPRGATVHMRRPRRAGVVALAVAAAIAAVSLAAIAPPYPRDATAQKSEFSAERAMAHLRELAAAPRPVGGLAHQRARDHLLTTLREYGLTAKVQESVGVDPSPRRAPTAASVENVVGVLPGSRSTGRLFLMAHYDSVAAGPGASDDGAGVAALLETARALASGPRLRNDVVFVFTDAEETCLCGAEAFVREHPLARDGGVVLNLEARGSSGAVVMFETTPGNAQLVEVFAEWAPYPLA